MQIKFEITDQAKAEATEYRKKILAIGLIDQRGYNDQANYIGYLGEWIFNEFLKQNKISEIKWSRETNGMADNGDFFFNSKIIDVKTASKPFHKMIMMPETQFIKHQRDYYVAVRLNLEEGYGEILGFVTYDDFKNTEIKDYGYGATLSIGFNKLRPITELIHQEVLKKWVQTKH